MCFCSIYMKHFFYLKLCLTHIYLFQKTYSNFMLLLLRFQLNYNVSILFSKLSLSFSLTPSLLINIYNFGRNIHVTFNNKPTYTYIQKYLQQVNLIIQQQLQKKTYLTQIFFCSSR